jgi:hypothetical protein
MNWLVGDIVWAPLLGEMKFTGSSLGMLWFVNTLGEKIGFDSKSLENRLLERGSFWRKYNRIGPDNPCAPEFYIKEVR